MKTDLRRSTVKDEDYIIIIVKIATTTATTATTTATTTTATTTTTTTAFPLILCTDYDHAAGNDADALGWDNDEEDEEEGGRPDKGGSGLDI